MRLNWKFVILTCLMSAATTIFAAQSTHSPERVTHKSAKRTNLTREIWREEMKNIVPPTVGCFHAKYPSTTLEQVACKAAPPYPALVPPKIPPRLSKEVGNGHDYILLAPQGVKLTKVIGSFPASSGVESIKSVGVPDSYMLQINTNYSATSSACQGHKSCSAVQQFIYAPNAVYMQYWLVSYGYPCPDSSWSANHGSCYKNSEAVPVSKVPTTQLNQVQLSGAVNQNGKDIVTFLSPDETYIAAGKADVLNIYQAWNSAEFNVFGDCCGYQAVFNPDSSLIVKTTATYATASIPSDDELPTCKNGGETAETNNLNLGNCFAVARPSPYIQFTQSNIKASNLAAPVIIYPTEGQKLPSNKPFTPSGTALPSAPLNVVLDNQLYCQTLADSKGAWSCPDSGFTKLIGSHTLLATQNVGQGESPPAVVRFSFFNAVKRIDQSYH